MDLSQIPRSKYFAYDKKYFTHKQKFNQKNIIIYRDFYLNLFKKVKPKNLHDQTPNKIKKTSVKVMKI